MEALPPRALCLAPMVALSCAPLRETIASFGGCDLYYGEMASARAYLAEAAFDAYFLDAEPEPSKTMVQFYGTEREGLVAATSKYAALALASGRPPRGIDLNFGCSAPFIERSGGGVSWMRDPEGSSSMAAEIRAATKGLELSAKLRIGYEDDYPALLAFCKGLEQAGLDRLVLHPRLKSEKFRRSGRWEYLPRLASELRIPVLGNGDIRKASECLRRLDDFSPAGVMIGREAVRRPWFFALVRGKEADPGYSMEVDREKTAMRFLDAVEARVPPAYRLGRAKKFFLYYADTFSFAHHLRWKIQNAPDLEAIRSIFLDYLAEVPSDRLALETD